MVIPLLGDRLCWVYDLPVRLYGRLSIFGLHHYYTACLYHLPFPIFSLVSLCTSKLLGDGLCWVYNPPICLYGKLSTFRLHLLYSV